MKTFLRALSLFIPVIVAIVLATYVTQPDELVITITPTPSPSPTIEILPFPLDEQGFYDGAYAGCIVSALGRGPADNAAKQLFELNCRAFAKLLEERDLFDMFYNSETPTPVVEESKS